jgi:hypothetical protein
MQGMSMLARTRMPIEADFIIACLSCYFGGLLASAFTKRSGLLSFSLFVEKIIFLDEKSYVDGRLACF